MYNKYLSLIKVYHIIKHKGSHMCAKIKKGQDYVENGKKLYVTAEEAAEMLGISTDYAYQIVRG